MVTEKDLMQMVVDAALEEKAIDLVVLDVFEQTIIADYFVICSGRNIVQIHSIADNVEKHLQAQGISVLRRDGYQQGTWVVLDYGSTILHIFRQEERDHYQLEDLWADARKITMETGN
ncbi:MAG TPA: ribosome silencing factor [Syntrophomonadaceae bacterium]|nr:ribosome silencing factor [Syntrophomonadaceae bacterium]